jgi:hypothetical protein
MPARQTAADLQREVGHPKDRWDALIASVPDSAVTRFVQVERDWLDLMWCLDAYRTAGICPPGMGNPTKKESDRLAAVYRGKGNWFATLLAALLVERTHGQHVLAPRGAVVGFSQDHQVDIAWPARKKDVLICVETKVTGAPAYGDTGPRGAMSDFTNRRKELKFAATDLKLYRRQQETTIDHWGVWRSNARPLTYFLWAARLREPGPVDSNRRRRWAEDHIDKLVTEAQALVNTYLDGAGIYAWKLNRDQSGYEPVPLPRHAQVTSLDDVLYRIASEINRATADAGGRVPPPVTPPEQAVQTELLAEDDEP